MRSRYGDNPVVFNILEKKINKKILIKIVLNRTYTRSYCAINLAYKANYLIVLAMEQIKSPFSIAPIQLPSGYSIFKRIANLVLVVATVVVCINLWLISSKHSTNWHNKQANQLGNSLTSFAANILTKTLIAKDPTLLTEQLSYIASDPHVDSVTIYDDRGQLLADNNASASVVATFKLRSFSPLVFVRKITHEQQTIGYLSVILNEQAIMAFHSEYQHQLNQQLQMLMVLAAIFGIVITRAFYKLRYRQIIRVSKN